LTKYSLIILNIALVFYCTYLFYILGQVIQDIGPEPPSIQHFNWSDLNWSIIPIPNNDLPIFNIEMHGEFSDSVISICNSVFSDPSMFYSIVKNAIISPDMRVIVMNQPYPLSHWWLSELPSNSEKIEDQKMVHIHSALYLPFYPRIQEQSFYLNSFPIIHSISNDIIKDRTIITSYPLNSIESMLGQLGIPVHQVLYQQGRWIKADSLVVFKMPEHDFPNMPLVNSLSKSLFPFSVCNNSFTVNYCNVDDSIKNITQEFLKINRINFTNLVIPLSLPEKIACFRCISVLIAQYCDDIEYSHFMNPGAVIILIQEPDAISRFPYIAKMSGKKLHIISSSSKNIGNTINDIISKENKIK